MIKYNIYEDSQESYCAAIDGVSVEWRRVVNKRAMQEGEEKARAEGSKYGGE